MGLVGAGGGLPVSDRAWDAIWPKLGGKLKTIMPEITADVFDTGDTEHDLPRFSHAFIFPEELPAPAKKGGQPTLPPTFLQLGVSQFAWLADNTYNPVDPTANLGMSNNNPMGSLRG